MSYCTSPECFVVNDGNNSNNLLTAALMGGGNGFGGGMWNNPIWAIVFLAALRNGGLFGNNGWDGNGNHPCTTSQLTAIQETLNSNHGQTLLMDAIKGNAGSIHELATTLNCNQNAVTAAINAVQSAICNVSNQVGMGTAQVINAVQNGDTSIITAIKDCCCQTQQNIIKMGYDNQINNLQQSQLIQNGFCQVGYEAAQNANGIKQSIADQTLAVTSKIDALESSRKDREINALTAQVATLTARAERAAELAPIYKALEEIKGKQPSVATVPYPNLVGIPASMLYGGAIAAGAAAGVFGVGGNKGGIFG